MTDIQTTIAPLLGTQVVIRARDDSTFFGTLESVDGRVVVLRDARRIRAWSTAGKETTLSGPFDHVVIQL